MVIAFILAFFTGVFSVLLLEAFLLYKWWSSKEQDTRGFAPQRTKVSNPKAVVDYLTTENANVKESCNSVNLLLTFLWREWRDSPEMKNFFLKKMNVELSELMHGRAAGRVIEQITVQNFSLGTSLPVFEGATVMNVESNNPEEVPHELDIALDLEYSGGCHLTIQVDLLFSRSVQLKVTLIYLKGRARLRLSRTPCTHWSLAFYEEPEVEFEAESQFEGRNFPQLSSLIVNHLRKSLHKKHTLPNYKLRFHPFFAELLPQDESQQVYVHNSLIAVGNLEVNIIGCSRLPEAESGASLYCSVSVDSLPWKQLAETKRNTWPYVQVEISREQDVPFGLTLTKNVEEDEFGKIIMIETVAPDSPAARAGIQVHDILVAVDGQDVESLKQAAKLIKSKTRFSAKLQRPPTGASFDETVAVRGSHPLNVSSVMLSGDDSESDEEFVNIVVPLYDSEVAKSSVREILTGSTELRYRGADKKKDKASGAKSQSLADENLSLLTEAVTEKTPRDHKLHPPKESQSRPHNKQEPDKTSGNLDTQDSSARSGEAWPGTKLTANVKRASVVTAPVFMADLGIKNTKVVSACQEPVWNDHLTLEVTKNDEFVNICVWSRFADRNLKDLLVGYITVPVVDIAMQCVATSSRQHEQCYVLNSPHCDRVVASQPGLRDHSGLKRYLCGGDITVVFRHQPSLSDCDETLLSKLDSLKNLTEPDEASSADKHESTEPKKHRFNLTQFYFPTRCNFCSKKVWTKIAFQCRTCAMICHKKCLKHCLSYSHCTSTGRSKRWPFMRSTTEEENPTSREKESSANRGTNPETDAQSGPTTADQVDVDGRAESRTSGPGTKDHNENGESRSEDATQNYDLKEDEQQGDDKEESDSRSDADETDDYAWSKADSDGQTDIAKVSAKVREVGREMFSNLPLMMRKSKLQEMMARLQVEIDEENETRTELYQLRKKAKGSEQKRNVQAMISKSEERSQALAMLMLQYCSGMQSCADTEEESCQV